MKNKPIASPNHNILKAAEDASQQNYLIGVHGWMAVGLVITAGLLRRKCHKSHARRRCYND